MAEDKKQFPTKKLREVKKYIEMTPEEKEVLDKRVYEYMKKYYENRPSLDMIIDD